MRLRFRKPYAQRSGKVDPPARFCPIGGVGFTVAPYPAALDARFTVVAHKRLGNGKLVKSQNRNPLEHVARLYRGRPGMSVVKRLFRFVFTPAAGQRKMPTASSPYGTVIVERAATSVTLWQTDKVDEKQRPSLIGMISC